MSEWVKAMMLGMVEGMTEFLPVSSTGHLILAGDLLNFQGDGAHTFEVVIQLGAVLAVLLLYWKRYWAIAADLIRFRFPKDRLNAIHMVLAMIPALVVYLLFKDLIKTKLFGPGPVLWALILGGLLLLVSVKIRRKRTAETSDDLSYGQALGIGLFQCLALWPGFSRSGSTISGGMLLGTSQKAAADFTFIISVPVMLGATVLDMYASRDQLSSGDLGLFLVGFLAAFAVGMVIVTAFLKLIKKLDLSWFAYYRFALAGLFYFFVMR
ncbi:undecaprenyl-diphosphate phosphatase [Paenibacillus aurantius]|uniref:Undecaprenyl-diphosphatase n=1 Tax=Paenibacillus aurantius TaxID=2918900 RepID=A0AA96RCS9_9BACL|nr:undecaprenyl-diphosphate phosphatase [Paenibacillus aurantius]WNQ09027.1 undecaprenyl-diphosphate phosphatase [Paenibacillus aurantius]